MDIKKHLIMHTASFAAMFVTMYVMIDNVGHFYFNLNKAYMSLLMVASMIVVNTLLMPNMYQSPKMRFGFMSAGIGLTLILIGLIRSQTFISNKPFLRAMIPHHSSAILMCEQAAISDPEIRDLCDQIVKAQKQEISQMKQILNSK